MITASILSVIFLALAILHFYWALGGKWVFEAALPTKANGEFVFYPKPIESWVVGIGLLLFGGFYLTRLGIVSFPFSNLFSVIISWVIPSIFLLRTIGEFRYVGLFKKVKATDFAQRDSKFYTPLCFILFTLGILDIVF